MKAVILAGGLGTRLSEETLLKPKPMVEIGGKPIIWHIMKSYSSYGVNDFIICCGYKGYILKEYFNSYHNSDITYNLANNTQIIHKNKAEQWKVTLIDTGELTMTGGRLKRVREYLSDSEPFCFTYGDGLADLDISKLIEFHRSHKRQATITAVLPPARFGALELDENRVTGFLEKPASERGFINGGFFVLEPSVVDLISDDTTIWEREPMELLAQEDNLRAYKHKGFWSPMDTLREKNQLEKLWSTGNAPWKSW
jgi:glucose-1-phosphate cytidylyltransferase